MKDLTIPIYEVGLHAGAALTLELIEFYGLEMADSVTGKGIAASLTDDEQEILFDAVQRIVALRIAPNDPATLPEPQEPATACRRADCQVCRAAGPGGDRRST
ncbi:hypothetical protein [Acrocarpospora catenulata]|uniref:hypothetical protein n=1 Tax=Acrocarpospora catenulata TaxID=2836182 RepID=UPI001BDAE3D4|nr:hypothetical protein [Acrocarpospora catenulata]